ncbi:hypothetical protein [Actinomadura alba]|uniref:Uncharacterized protein n=1 Tax=Actinomadura alba TaxID=406431 RepID=A0ABR7LJV0_9ACTN|nr:hypothetical protein [Actinomadura alba]MBC6464757.1 hypothetical protein [Actinomadura alba]
MSTYLSHGPALSAQQSFVTSALPDAPVIPHVEPRQRTAVARRKAAVALHSLADRIAPAPKEQAC